jgi:hypothetical protein
MTRLRSRRLLALLTVGLVVFAAFVPAVAAHLPAVILVPLWLILPAAATALIRREALCCDEQSVPLLSLTAPRAPPSTLA